MKTGFLKMLLPMTLMLCILACKPSNNGSIQNQFTDSLSLKNKALVTDFFTISFIKKDLKTGFDKYIGEKYIQHNPNVTNGREQPIQYLGQWLKENPEASCEIKRVIAEKDLVVIHSHWKNSPKDRGQAGVDIFRVENNKIVEHWDVLQDVPEKSANTNTMF